MAETDAKNETEDTSTAVDLDDIAVGETRDGSDAQGENGAKSSVAPTDETESEGALSVVRDVVDASRKAQEDAAASSAEGKPGAAEGDAETPQTDDENYSDVPFHKHPRFQHLLRAKKAAEIDAIAYRNVTAYLESNGLTSEEASEVIEIRALMRNDPEKAWELLKPHVTELLTAIGEIVPDDIAARVHNGEISRETALELAKARAKGTTLEERQKRDTERRKAEDERRRVDSLRNAAISWAEDRAAKDPLFAEKHELVMRELAWLQTKDGKPDTPDGVRAQLKKAYDAVNASYVPKTATRPAPKKPMKPVTQSGSTDTTAAPEPKSTLDLIQQEVGKRAA